MRNTRYLRKMIDLVGSNNLSLANASQVFNAAVVFDCSNERTDLPSGELILSQTATNAR